MRDLVLIGMPGCGKSTIGKLLEEKLNMDFYDSDYEVERKERLCIPEIFKNRGEAYFRKCETQVISNLLNNKNIVATGGGAVLREENRKLFKERNAFVVFIDRPLDMIVSDIRTDNRPLLTKGKERIYTLYEERYDVYNKVCDARILNDKDAETAAEEIIKLYKGENIL